MADIKSAISSLRTFAQDELGDSNPAVGRDNGRPYYKSPEGTLYGVLFGDSPHAGDALWARGPVAIIKFPSGVLSSRNYEVVKWLTTSEDSQTS